MKKEGRKERSGTGERGVEEKKREELEGKGEGTQAAAVGLRFVDFGQ